MYDASVARLSDEIALQDFWDVHIGYLVAGGVTAVRPLAIVPDRFRPLVAEFFASGPTNRDQTRFWRWSCLEPPVAEGDRPRHFMLVVRNDGVLDASKLRRINAQPSEEPCFYPVPTYFDALGQPTTWRVFIDPTVYFDLRRWHLSESSPTGRPEADYWGFVSEPVLLRGMRASAAESSWIQT